MKVLSMLSDNGSSDEQQFSVSVHVLLGLVA